MFREFRAEVETALADALAAMDLPTDDLGVEEPPADVEATLASSVAFRLAGELGAPPPEVADRIAEAIDLTGAANGDGDGDGHEGEGATFDYLAAVTTQGPYLNFHVSDRYDARTLHAARRESFGQLAPRDESVVVEHTSANPTGPVHVGRARNPIVGDAVANVLAAAGYDVDRHYYVNDAGRQMAVFTWAYETFDEADLPPPARDRADYELVRYYRKGNEFLEDGPDEAVAAAETEIAAILQGLEAGDDATYERVGEVVDGVLGGMRESLGRLPVTFDAFVRETQFMRDGSTDDVAERLQATDAAVYEDDAWQLDLSAYDIEKTLVFLRSDGTSLYTTRDLAHHEWKFANYDRAVTVLGEDHKLQASQLEAALDLLGNDTDRLQDVFYSYVNLPEGKMSTRAGTAVDLDDLLDEAIARARDEVESRLDTRARDDDLDDADVDRIAEQVGVGAVRYDIVSKQPSKAITFEWEQALDFEAQSAPYVQYVHARCCGILDEAAAAGYDLPAPTAGDGGTETDADGDAETDAGAGGDSEGVDPSVLEAAEERALLRVIARYPAVVESAATELRPHVVATYTREIAETFNAFYRECPVLNADDDRRRTARLALVDAARRTVASALGLLGVAAPDSM
jgi:arginyl-tRNA synthetase